MDNVFVLQKWYTETTDGMLVKNLMERYSNWYLDKYIVEGDDYTLLPRETLIPVGNIPFVQKYLDHKMRPLEVPEELRSFLEREYFVCKGKDIPKKYLDREYFIKDADTLKKWNNALNPRDLCLEKETNYVVSERVFFDSEYRVFVHDRDILACQHYLGDPLVFPDAEKIKDVVRVYDGPQAYTLDIGIHDGKTDLIEIHPFACCGLYGFNSRQIIAMLKKGFDWYKEDKPTE